MNLQTFKQFLNFLPKKTNYASVYVGRFQPFHDGHRQIIEYMENEGDNVCVVIVKGKKTSKDSDKNPLQFDYQKELIKKINPNINIFQSPSGFLPAIFEDIKDKGFIPKYFYSGLDREPSYKKLIELYNKNNKKGVSIKVLPRFDNISATEIRKAIRSNDKLTFSQMMPKILHSEWFTLRKNLI